MLLHVHGRGQEGGRGAFPGDRLKSVQWSRSYIVKESYSA